MLTEKKKLRNRKHKLKRVYVLAGVIVVGFVGAYVLSLKLFPEVKYISPLATVLSDTSYHEDKDLALIKEGLKKSNIDVEAITNQNTTYHVKLKDDAEVVLSAKKDLNVQLSSLQFIVSRLTMEGKRFSRLDLTFDKPVIVLEK